MKPLIGKVEPQPTRKPSPKAPLLAPSALRRFLIPTLAPGEEHTQRPWHRVLWLTGVDYFSTLGYQPAIAFVAAGALSPIATLVLIAVTLGGALPIYAQVAKRSFAGQGSIAMLERLLPGWSGKLFVLGLLGFASTDFVITMTLSAADAATHAVENPLLHPWLGDHRIWVTLLLLALLAAVFLRGFGEAIGVAAFICVPYLFLNAIVLARGLVEMARRPELIAHWRLALDARGSWPAILAASVLVFPRLALGMSGFETGVSVMPLVRGDAGDGTPPAGRIRNTRRLLASAALLMSVLLVASSLVTTVLIPADAMQPGGKASGRALAWLAHELLGNGFGSVYDLSTILILWFAGASAMAGMLNLIPRYLPRFGMAPKWVEHPRPLIALLFGIDVLVTLVFRADVDAQGGAYATGVLALMLSASVAVALSLWREARADGARQRSGVALSLFFWLASAVFAYTFADNVMERPDGVIIATIFTTAILLCSALSRIARSLEFRVEKATFADAESTALWEEIRGRKVSLVPVREKDEKALRDKVGQARESFHAQGQIAFLHVSLADDRSDFTGALQLRVRRSGEHLLIEVRGASAIANAIAWVSEQLDPLAIYIELSLRHPVAQSLEYLLWGEGEVGVMVYQILVNHWHSTPEDDVRPQIVLVSS